MKSTLAALLLGTLFSGSALTACMVGEDDPTPSDPSLGEPAPPTDTAIAPTDDADDGPDPRLSAHVNQNPAPFDLHCLWAGESYASRAPNQYAAAAIREACDIQAHLVPYRFPGANPWRLTQPTPAEGTDCSGFSAHVWYVATGGWTRLNHSAANQEATLPHVSWSQMLPGDLLFYVSSAAASGRHVAMYLGDGLMIEAASSTRGIVVVPARTNVSSIGRVW
jgi:cell wall-associated NlpC family hydrolase